MCRVARFGDSILRVGRIVKYLLCLLGFWVFLKFPYYYFFFFFFFFVGVCFVLFFWFFVVIWFWCF